MKANPSRADVVAAIDRAFSPDVTITLDADWKAVMIDVHTDNGIVWNNRTTQRFNRPLAGLSVDSLTAEWPGITFETILPNEA